VVIHISAPWLVGFILAFVRSLAWLMFVPPFGNRQTIPPVATVGIALSLAVVVAPHVAGGSVPLTTPSLIGAVAIQVLTADPSRVPLEEWTELAAALRLDPRSGPGRSA
jgi:flagellar biosynthesis protein FliR